MKKVARLRVPQDEFVPPTTASIESSVGIRTTGRIKKPKAVYDPSDNYVPRAQRVNQVTTQQQFVTSPKAVTQAVSPSALTASRERPRERSLSTGSNTSNNSSHNLQDTDICKVCQKREPRRGGNYRNRITLTCINCSQKVHRLCFGTDFLESAPVRQNFKCATCRTCLFCESSKQKIKATGDLMTCAKCLASYHVTCHTPKITKQQLAQRNWKCCKCASAVTPVAANESNENKEESLPVTVIRQIIGYDTNMQTLPVKRASPKPEQPLKELRQEQKKTSDELKFVVESPVKAESKAVSRSQSEMSSSSSPSESDASEDEDYAYVEKKKRRLLPEANNNGGNKTNNGSAIETINGDAPANGNQDVEMDDHVSPPLHDQVVAKEPEPKKIMNTVINTIDDLPNRDDVRSWSVEKLAKYVQKYFPNEAQVLKEHEIDGNALLLLKRSDVVKKLPLKLGPALHLYNFILKIQTQKPNDPTLGWDCSVDTTLPSTE